MAKTNAATGDRWRKARALLERARPVVDLWPITRLGLWVIVGSAVALKVYGYGQLDLLLLCVGLFGLALSLLCLLLVVAGALRVAAGKPPASDASVLVEAQSAIRTDFSLPALRFWPLIGVRWSWLSPSAAIEPVLEGSRLTERVMAAGRGLGAEVVRRVEVADVFGLCSVAFRLREARPVRVLPAMGRHTLPRVLRSLSSGDEAYDPLGGKDGERIDLRPYAPGDPPRLLLWKVYARTGQLIVRQPERAVAPDRKAMVYLVSGEHDEAAAGVTRVAVERGALGKDWVLGVDGDETRASTAADAVALLCGSVRARGEQEGAGLARFLQEARSGGAARVVLFVPSSPGPWLMRVRAALAGARLRGASALVCVDGAKKRAPTGWLARLVFTMDEGRARSEGLEVVCKALAEAGCVVEVVERGIVSTPQGLLAAERAWAK